MLENRPPSSTRESLSVLVVDDDPLLGEFVSMQIEGLGCRADCVDSGVEGLARVADGSVDLLITDYMMPGMDGMELVRRARAEAPAEGFLHIAMMTTRGEDGVIRAAMTAGVDDFLYKPIQEVELELAVESAVRGRTLHRRLRRRNTLLSSAHRRTREALERVQADLAAATALHERLLPPQGRIGTLDITRIYRPAAMLGGDSIGIFRLPEEDNALLFFLIDVCGHGVPAALDSFHLHHRIKQLRPTDAESLGGALAQLNREVCERGDDSYATVSCGLVFPDEERGWIVSAGHPPPLVSRGGTVSAIEDGRALPVGWFDDVVFEPCEFAFPEGSRIVLYSDGVTECEDADGEEFGLTGLCDSLSRHGAAPFPVFAADLEQALQARVAGRGFADDISLLAIENADDRADVERERI